MTARVEGPGWHWEADSGGEGLQHLALTSEQQREALRAQLRESNGDPTLEIVDASAPGYAERAAALFRRDGFVAVSPAMSDAQLEALRAKALQVAGEIVGLDQHGGQKGVGRFMFGGSCSFSGSQMHQREFAMMAELPVVDAVLSEIWGTDTFFCTGSGGDIAMPGSEYQPLHSVGLLPSCAAVLCRIDPSRALSDVRVRAPLRTRPPRRTRSCSTTRAASWTWYSSARPTPGQSATARARASSSTLPRCR